MLWPGTLIGAGAGFAIASIPGAMLGALLGQALDRRLQLRSWAQLREMLGGRSALRNDELLFVLLGRLAKSNGRVMDGHIQQARREMQSLEMTEAARQRAIAAFNRGKSGHDPLRRYLRRLSVQPHASEGVLRACWRMVWADGRAGTAERKLIAQWGKWLGWKSYQVQALAADYEPARRSMPNSTQVYQDAMQLLRRVGMQDHAHKYPWQLSGGQQQRVAIARALAMKPEAMLFDEPTSALDPELVGDVLGVMRQLAEEGMTMIVVTHEMAFAREVADRVCFLHGGTIVEAGPSAQVLGAPRHARTQDFLRRVLHQHCAPSEGAA